MEGTFKIVTNYIDKEKLININYTILKTTGGFCSQTSGINNKNGLDYLLEVLKNNELFGYKLYSTMYEKATLLTFNIIKNHIFFDGNKRTGMIAGFYFLRINGLYKKSKIPDSEVIKTGIEIARNKITREEYVEWLKKYFDQTT